MPRSDEASAFYHSVYSAIQEIPYGKVTSYGHIARLIGTHPLPLSLKLHIHSPN
ncbi:6-o-methylguanine dna methyltransferase protein [Rutstroemia sp. NJR-2017a BBW]|nr:6-o-methylguanine dna methyltransferase protein [Rutstroemia sp. NJR-2017a BBW]